MIAHKYNTLLNCNRIIQIDNGKIVKDGSPKEIINSLQKEFKFDPGKIMKSLIKNSNSYKILLDYFSIYIIYIVCFYLYLF